MTLITELPRKELERAEWRVKGEVMKWNDDERLHGMGLASASSTELLALGIEPDEIVNAPDNVLTTAGIDRMLNLLIAAGGTAFNNANSRIGVGNNSGSLAEAASNTDLGGAAGATNRQFKVMTATWPQRPSTTSVAWRSDFQTGEANFVWAEWAVDNGTADGTTVTAPMFNRRVVALGTKASGIWTLTVTVTIA